MRWRRRRCSERSFHPGRLRRGTGRSGKATDETTICERIGVPVAYVPLDSNNMKLTTAYDVKLAKAVCFLAESERKEREKG